MMRPLAPLVPASTYRRGVHVLLGGVIALPYALLAAAFVQMLAADDLPHAAVLLLLAIALVVSVTPAFLDGTRAVEVAAARGPLDVDLPDPDRPGCGRRCAAMHVAFGGLVGLALLTAVPMALVMVLRSFGVAGIPLPLVGGLNPVVIGIVGVLLLVVGVCAVAGLGGAAAQVAPAPLGPSRAERIAVLEEQAVRLAERNRLARDVHDSVGHALTVTTIRAAAARSSDPVFLRNALTAIEAAGRSAMEDLDHVLGLLRDDASAPAAPQRALAGVDRIVADARPAGLALDVAVDGVVGSVPAVVSREGCRIVQEGLTNVVRHAGRVPATLRIALADRTLRIDVRPAPERVRWQSWRGSPRRRRSPTARTPPTCGSRPARTRASTGSSSRRTRGPTCRTGRPS